MTKQVNPIFDAALDYLARGWNIIPLRQDKRPTLTSWQEFQSRRVTEAEARAWFSRSANNIGVVTGEVSGLVVVDLDGDSAVQAVRERGGLPPTPCVITGKGYHYYLAHPGRPVANAAGLAGVAGLDIRGDGGYVVAPPSVHPSGRRYRWARGRSPGDLPPAPCPEWLLDLLADRGRRGRETARGPGKTQEPGWVEELLAGVPEGMRDDACTRLAGHFLGKGLPEGEVLALLLAWNLRNRPPLPEKEVRKCVRSVARRESKKPARTPPGGPVFVPPDWDGGTAVLTADWQIARNAARRGKAAVVLRRDGNLPDGAGDVLARARDIKTAGLDKKAASRLAWLIYPFRAGKQVYMGDSVDAGMTEKWETLRRKAASRREAPPAAPNVPAAFRQAEPPGEQTPTVVSEDAPSRFELEAWASRYRPDLLAEVRAAEKQCEAAYWWAEAGYPEELRRAEAALDSALQRVRAATSQARENASKNVENSPKVVSYSQEDYRASEGAVQSQGGSFSNSDDPDLSTPGQERGFNFAEGVFGGFERVWDLPPAKARVLEGQFERFGPVVLRVANKWRGSLKAEPKPKNPRERTPKIPDVVAAEIKRIEAEALAAGWKREELWEARPWVPSAVGNAAGLASMLHPGDVVAGVEPGCITIRRKSGVVHRFQRTRDRHHGFSNLAMRSTLTMSE